MASKCVQYAPTMPAFGAHYVQNFLILNRWLQSALIMRSLGLRLSINRFEAEPMASEFAHYAPLMRPCGAHYVQTPSWN